MGDLDEALALRRTGDGYWTAHADPRYEAIIAMYGGWTVAIALRSVIDSHEGNMKPSAVTVNFIDRVEPETELKIQARQIGGSRSVGFWQTEITEMDARRTLAAASVVLTERRDTDGLTVPSMPDAPEPESLEAFHPPIGPEGERTLICPVIGFPAQPDTSARSIGWIRETSGRAVDHLQLAFLSDQCPPRPLYWGNGQRPSATLTLSVYFHATDDELDAVGDDYILQEAVGTRGARSTSGQYAQLWSRRGELLATSEQLVWFR